MIIRDVDACWLSVPIPIERQHVSDFGRITSFDMALVRIEADDGLVGWGEAKAAVGSAGGCAALVSCINDELGRQLVGQDARRINAAVGRDVQRLTRGTTRSSRGARFPVLGRRGLDVAAMSGIDMALWDLLGKSLGVPVVDLWGGPCRADMPLVRERRLGRRRRDRSRAAAATSTQGFGAVKMRVGVMDGDVDTSVDTRRAARAGARARVSI